MPRYRHVPKHATIADGRTRRRAKVARRPRTGERRRAASAVLAVLALVLGLTGASIVVGPAAQAANTPISNFTKTGIDTRNGSTANAATGVHGTGESGDTVKWALSYQNKTGADADVTISDPLTDGQSYVPNSLQTAPNFTGDATNGAITAHGTVLSTATSGRSPTFNAAAVNFSTPGGDGYSVEGFGDKIYTVFHHNASATVVFCATLTNAVCPGWPGYSSYVDPTAGTPLGQGTAGVYTSAMVNGSFISNGQLFWPVEVNGTPDRFGFQCLDLTALTSCGYTEFGTTTQPGYAIAGDGIAAADGNRYYIDDNGIMHCVSPTGTSCGSTDVAHGVLGSGGSGELGTYGRYVYASYTNAANTGSYLTCFDTTAAALCDGFPIATGAVPPANRGSEVMPVLSSDGTFLGACAIYDSACFTPSGVALSNPWTQTTYAFGPSTNQGFGTGVLVGTRYYTGNGDVDDCYDFAQPLVGGKVQACAAFATHPPNVRSYTVRALANLPGCMASNGDGAQIQIFNARTGAPCASASQSVKLAPSDYYCDGRSGHIESWGEVTLPGLDGSEYAGATLTLLGADGTPLPGWTNVPFPDSGPQTIDISAIPVSGNTATLTAQVNIAAVSDTAAVNASRVTATWQGDQTQIVCYETVLPPTPCLTSTVVSNTATAVTTAGSTTDAPDGNSSGAAIFDVTPSAAQCLLHLTKTGSPDPAKPGTTVTYTIDVHNTGTFDYLAADPARFTDDITDVLGDSGYDAGSLTATAGGATYDPTTDVISWSGPLAAGATATITYTVTVNTPDTGDHSMFNRVVTPPGTPSNCATGSTDPDCDALVEVPDLQVAKTADPADGTTVVAGQVVTYTLTFRNTGKGRAAVDYTDDLTGVLDDADVTSAPQASNANLTASAVANDAFTVTGAVPGGATYTVSYQVTVGADGTRGDDDMVNVAFPTGTTPPASCVAGDPLCTEHRIPEVTVTKASDPVDGSDVAAGDAIKYTLTFHNIGKATGALDYVDYLSDVLDDAVITKDPTASDADVTVGAVANDQLPIGGTIPAGATYTVSYVVTVNPYTQQGNHVLLNFVAGPGATPPPPGACVNDPSCVVHAVPHLTVTKDASTTERPAPGDQVSYRIVVTNDGGTDYPAGAPASLVDNLTDVLDDATYDGDVSADRPDAPAVTGNQLTWSGALAIGQAVTITYSVTYHGTGDTVMVNRACVPKQGTDPACATASVPAALITPSKSVDPADGTTVVAGQELTYTLTFANSGQGAGDIDYTDDLSKVLDDAAITGGPTASNPALTVSSVVNGAFEVTGTVPAGATYTVTVKVTVGPDGQRGDDVLDNFLVPTGQDPPATCEAGDPLCTHNPVPEIVPSKSVDPADGATVSAGGVLTYTLTFHNVGAATGSIDYTDDLTDVLDDAALKTSPAASNADLTVGAIVAGTFTVTGTVPVGATYTVTYAVTVKPAGDRGNDRAQNFLVHTGDGHGPDCVSGDPLCTDNPMPDVVDWKTVDPASGTPVVPGRTLTYTLHFTNRGTVEGPVDSVDDITHVVDDATVLGPPTSSDPALTVTPFGADDRAAITGTLAAGQTVTVTYRVKVNDPDAGDSLLANFLLAPGDPTPTDPTCRPADPQLPDCTSNPVGVLDVAKSVDPENFSDVRPGDRLTYRLTFHNTGAGRVAVDYTDHMAGVLDDATLGSDPVSSDAALTASPVAHGSFTVTGSLAGGQTVRVTYRVTVKAYADQGNHQLDNFLAASGPFRAHACVADDPLCTHNSVPDSGSGTGAGGGTGSGTAATGGDWRAQLVLGGLLLGSGLLLVVAARRRRRA